MANDTEITIIGNLTADPELRFTQNGFAIANCAPIRVEGRSLRRQ